MNTEDMLYYAIEKEREKLNELLRLSMNDELKQLKSKCSCFKQYVYSYVLIKTKFLLRGKRVYKNRILDPFINGFDENMLKYNISLFFNETIKERLNYQDSTNIYFEVLYEKIINELGLSEFFVRN